MKISVIRDAINRVCTGVRSSPAKVTFDRRIMAGAIAISKGTHKNR
ncbi:MAG: hypothetical protein V7K40_31205 [Nostoc sp.]